MYFQVNHVASPDGFLEFSYGYGTDCMLYENINIDY